MIATAASLQRRAASAIAAVLFVLAPAAVSEQQQRLAVLEFDNPQDVKIDRTYFSDLARGAVQRRTPQLFVMTRESTEALLQANGKTLADCTGECEVEVGRKLGADFIVSGRITKIGTRLLLTLRLFSTADGRLIDSEEARGKTDDELLDEADKAVKQLVEKLVPALSPAPASAQPATQTQPQAQTQIRPQTQPSAAQQNPPPPPPPAPLQAPRESAPAAPAVASRAAPSSSEAGAAQSGQAADGTPLAPHWSPFSGDGNELTISVSAGAMKPFQMIQREGGTELFNGVQAHYHETATEMTFGTQTTRSWTRSYFSQTARGVEMLGTRTFSSSGGIYTSDSVARYDPPLLAIPRSLKIGSAWHSTLQVHGSTTSWSNGKATDSKFELEMTVDGKILTHEDYTTPSGTYHCAEMETETVSTLSGQAPTKLETHIWFAPSVGFVELDMGPPGGPSNNKSTVIATRFKTTPWGTKGSL